MVSFAVDDDANPLAEMVRANASLQEWARVNIDSKLKLCEFEVSVAVSLEGKPVRSLKMSTTSPGNDLRVFLEPNDEPIQCEVRGEEEPDDDSYLQPAGGDAAGDSSNPSPSSSAAATTTSTSNTSLATRASIILSSTGWDRLTFRAEMISSSSGTRRVVLNGAYSRHQLVIAQKEEDYLEAGMGARVTLPQENAESAFRFFFFPGFAGNQGKVDIIKNFEAIVSLDDISEVTEVIKDSEGWSRLVDKF